DEHTAGDDMGSSSSLPFFTGGIEDSLREIPGERFVAAVPFYTRLWKKAGDGTLSSEALSLKGAQDWVQKNAVQLDWDETLGQYTGNSRADDGSTAYIWMEEARSMQLKLDAVRSQNIAGVACWRLGLETDDMWGIVGKQ
ncbi:MAG: glycosyl hydrolase family 18 protein, partial [Lachnospiraceae bacterium]